MLQQDYLNPVLLNSGLYLPRLIFRFISFSSPQVTVVILLV